MDISEALRVVENRILKLESQEFAHKFRGYVCQHYQNDEIIQFALGPDISIQNLIAEAKVSFQLSSSPIDCPPILPSVNSTSISDPSLQYTRFQFASPRNRSHPPRLARAGHEFCFQSAAPRSWSLPPRLARAGHREYGQTEVRGLKDQFEPFDSVASGSKSYFCNEGGVNNISLTHNQNVRSAPEVPVTYCYYFNKGFCKYGSKCWNFHGQSPPDNYSRMFGPNPPAFGYEDQDIRSAPEVTVKHCYFFNKGLCKYGSECLYFHEQSPPDNYSRMFGPNPPEFGYEDQDIRSAPEVTVKHCYFFNKGLCKYGNKCLYFHGQSAPDNYSRTFGLNSPEFGYEDQVFTPGSLKRLEMEITELLKCRGGGPISIASLPYLYFETYKKQLLVEGYPAETERHGKLGIELMKLLALPNTAIRLVQRPDGESVIMLAEDAAKNLKVRAETNNLDPVDSGSRQVYITFKSDCTFTEEDVSNYFRTFGPVQEVIFPRQPKRMFGFVTFVSSDTVRIVLAKGNRHFVCGTCVHVKPSVEESKFRERTNYEEPDAFSYSLHHMDINSEHQSRFHTQQLMEEHNKALDVKFGGPSNLSLSQSPHGNQSNFDRSIQESGVSQDANKFPSAEQNDGHLTETSRTDPDSSEGYHLPPNLFE